jgi:signal transduction histidine kinase
MVDGDKVYAGEPDGVYLYQSGFRQRTKVDDLPLVRMIRKDGRGGLWLKTVHDETKGVAPVPGKEPVADLPSHLLMPVSNIEVKAQYQHGSQVWIGGNEILAVIDTGKKDLEKLSDCRTIRFCSILMDNDSVLWGGYGDMPKKLQELDSDEGNLHFFYALDYAPLTGKTLYRYRLSNQSLFGSKGQWSAWSEKHDVAFLSLPYGSFTLSVQARLANGELSEVASVRFGIAYPLLLRWYMVAVYLIVFACLVWLMFRYRLRKLQKDKIKLEQIVEERTADLRNAQHELIRQEKMASVGKLTEGLIDRILNPMNFIIYFSKMANDLKEDIKENIDNNKDGINKEDYEDTLDVFDRLTEVLQNIDQYGRNTTRTLKAMEEVLKDRTGGYVDMDLLPVLQQSEEMLGQNFAKEITQYHILTVFSLPTPVVGNLPSMPVHGNPDMLRKTIINLLGNAVYAVVRKAQKTSYTPEVSLTATVTDGHCVLKIRDNGIGIEEKVIGKIFDPFFTTKTTDEAAGVGLYLSREIIQNHKGDISVASVKDEYTEFTITLPILQTT